MELKRDQLRGVLQVLAQDPAKYLAFGPFWWEIKNWTKKLWPENGIIKGNRDEILTRARLRKLYPDEQTRFAAALRHFEVKVSHGEAYDGMSEWPHIDEPYSLYDPDMEWASFVSARS